MAVGTGNSGATMAPTDVHGAGDVEWAQVGGVQPGDPRVSGRFGGFHAGDPDVALGMRMVTTPEGQLGPATGGLMATPDGIDSPGIALWDSWRDLFNFTGSPMPWLLIGALIVLGLMEFRIQARAGLAGRKASAAAAVG